MSTKIHHGYRLPGRVSVPALARHLSGVMEPVGHELTVGALATVTALLLAHQEQGIEELSWGAVSAAEVLPGTPITQAAGAVDLIRERGAATSRRVHPILELDVAVTVCSDPANKGWSGGAWAYALLYTQREEYLAEWERTPGVEPWPYWNNTDPPEGVCEREWEYRNGVWDRVLGRVAPATTGVTWELQQPSMVSQLHLDEGLPHEVATRVFSALTQEGRGRYPGGVEDVLAALLHSD